MPEDTPSVANRPAKRAKVHFHAGLIRSYVRDMNLLLRLGTLSGVTAGLLLGGPGLIEAFTGETLATSVLIGLAPALAAPLITALYVGQLSRSPHPGGLGYALNTVGLGLFGAAAFALNIVIFPLDPDLTLAPTTRIVILSGAAIYIVGTVWFSINMLRNRVYPRPAVALYLVSMPLFPVAAQLPDSPLTAGIHVIAAVALIWLAWSLRRLETDGGSARTTTKVGSAAKVVR